jgi:hypothetical protein
VPSTPRAGGEPAAAEGAAAPALPRAPRGAPPALAFPAFAALTAPFALPLDLSAPLVVQQVIASASSAVGTADLSPIDPSELPADIAAREGAGAGAASAAGVGGGGAARARAKAPVAGAGAFSSAAAAAAIV